MFLTKQFAILIMTFSFNWCTTLDYEMPSSSDTLQELLTDFVPIAWNTTSEIMVLYQPDLDWSSTFLKPSEIYLTIWLLYCDQLCLQFS